MDQMIVITKDELSENTESDKGQISEQDKASSFQSAESYSRGQSDNIGCDVLLKLIGGPRKSNRLHPQPRHKGYSNRRHGAADAREVGYASIRVDNAAGIFSAAEKFTLKNPFRKELRVSAVSFVRHKNRAKRLPAGLPAGTPLHTRPASSAVINGITGGVNDIGIVTLPDGHTTQSASLSLIPEDMETNEKIIADIS